MKTWLAILGVALVLAVAGDAALGGVYAHARSETTQAKAAAANATTKLSSAQASLAASQKKVGDLSTANADLLGNVTDMGDQLRRARRTASRLQAANDRMHLRMGTLLFNARKDVTAICGDLSYSFSANAQGTCSSHSGVALWVNHP